MEQSSDKIERFLLGAGLAAALALAAAQYFSPAAKALADGRDLRVVLLAESVASLLVYHPATSTVNTVVFPKVAARRGVSGYQRASELIAMTGAADAARQGEVFYIALSSAPDMQALWAVLNNWRSAPLGFAGAAGWAAGLHKTGATNISPFGLFVLFSEFSKLNSSNFILTEMPRSVSVPDEENTAASPERPTVRVEVFNASGKKDLAAHAAKYLRAAGFDVLTASSYGKIEKQTRILCFSGDTAAALKLRAALGLEGREIHVRAAQKSIVEASVILGTDFNSGVLGKAEAGK